MIKKIQFFSIISIILVFLVILAGSTVRMTGSGMGCPDWPKCFGYYIPPTEISQILFKSNNDYLKGQMILYDKKKLLVAKSDFISNDIINLDNWKVYEKHDYVLFNPVHTWFEFINRLLGAVLGLSILILFLFSLSSWKNKPIIFITSLLSLLAVLFQAWLGKTVVDSNLAPYKISIHMLMALVLVGLLLCVRSFSKRLDFKIILNKPTTLLIYFSFLLTIIQIALGLQVREFIDTQIDKWGYDFSNYWLLYPENNFYVHRSLSVLVLISNFLIYYLIKKQGSQLTFINKIILLISIEIVLGILMYYFDFPFASQPLHLLVATFLFGIQFYWILRINKIQYGLSI